MCFFSLALEEPPHSGVIVCVCAYPHTEVGGVVPEPKVALLAVSVVEAVDQMMGGSSY